MAITLRQLGYFIALAETRHFGLAAARVHVSQPALSMQIADLERTVGQPLFERRPREVTLTRAGRDLLARAERITAEIREIEVQARQLGQVAEVTLGVIPTVAPYLLPGALMRLSAGQRIGDLRVREAQTARLFEGLDRGQLDAVVVATAAPGRDYVAETLFSDHFLLAGAPGRLAAAAPLAESLRPQALDPDQLLLLDEGHCLADQALDVCALDRSATRIDLGASSLATLCGLVAGGYGLTFLPEIAVMAEMASAPGIALRRFADPQPSRNIMLVRRKSGTGGGWFDLMADALRETGTGLLSEARRRCPVPSPR